MTDVLDTLPFVEGLNPIEYQRLSNAQKISMEEGAVLLRQGDTCQGFIILIEGCIRVFGRSVQGRELEMYRIEKMGTCVLTTSCLLAGNAYPAEAVVENDARILLIKDEDFSFLMSESTAFRRFVFESYSERLSGLLMLVQSIAFERIETRLARYLLKASQKSFVLSISHQDIADTLGTAREVISRHLKIMEQQHWLALSRGQIIILEPSLMDSFLKEQRLM